MEGKRILNEALSQIPGLEVIKKAPGLPSGCENEQQGIVEEPAPS
jgi:hypothetical protein